MYDRHVGWTLLNVVMRPQRVPSDWQTFEVEAKRPRMIKVATDFGDRLMTVGEWEEWCSTGKVGGISCPPEEFDA